MISQLIKKQFSTAGALLTWGETTYGWGREPNNNYYVPAPVEGFTDVVNVASGPYHLLIQTQSNEIFSTGLGDNGRLGNGSSNSLDTPQLIDGLRGLKISQLAAGNRHSLALTEKGDVYAWGYGGRVGGVWDYVNFFALENPCGIGQSGDVVTPTLIEDISGVKQIAAGRDMSFAIGSDGKFYGWGQTGSSRPELMEQFNYFLHKNHSNVVKISCVDQAILVLLDNGRIYVTGKNKQGLFATRTNPKVMDDLELYELTKIVDEDLKGEKIVDFENSANSLIFRTDSGAVFYSGMDRKFRPARFPFNGEVSSMFATFDSVGVIGADGSVNYLNDKFIENSVTRNQVHICKDPNLAKTFRIGGNYRLRYALVSQ